MSGTVRGTFVKVRYLSRDLGEVCNRSEDPRGGPGRVVDPRGGSGKGRGTLGEFRDG